MKKIISLLTAALLTLSVFAGCGKAEEAESDMMSGVSNAVSGAMTEAETMIDDMNNGAVSDGDGIIGNEGSEDNTTKASSTTNSSSTESSANSSSSDNTSPSDDLM